MAGSSSLHNGGGRRVCVGGEVVGVALAVCAAVSSAARVRAAAQVDMG